MTSCRKRASILTFQVSYNQRVRWVFLVGFMGCGKSTVGRLLAERLGMPFVDLDEEIECREGATITEIFEHGGESVFRAAETRALEVQLAQPPAVVATGGGLFIEEVNRGRIRRAGGCSVFLDTPFEIIAHRVAIDDASRPLWSDSVVTRRLYDERLPMYRLADIVISPQGSETSTEVAERVRREVEGVACVT